MGTPKYVEPPTTETITPAPIYSSITYHQPQNLVPENFAENVAVPVFTEKMGHMGGYVTPMQVTENIVLTENVGVVTNQTPAVCEQLVTEKVAENVAVAEKIAGGSENSGVVTYGAPAVWAQPVTETVSENVVMAEYIAGGSENIGVVTHGAPVVLARPVVMDENAGLKVGVPENAIQNISTGASVPLKVRKKK